MLQEQLELENACALTNALEIKDFSWFQFHVFTFATVGIAPRSVDPEADQCRSEIWEGHVRRADRGDPPNEQTAFEASLDERYFFPFGRSSRIRGLISCV